MPNFNGFEDMSDYFGKLIDLEEKVAMESLEEAANFYLEKLIPNIPKSLLKREHARDHVHVNVEKDKVQVEFDDKQFYWRFVENGAVGQRAQHFASGTFEQYKNEIEKIMTGKILKEMEG